MSDPKPDHPPLCAFCGKTQEQVKRIIMGHTAYICDECVTLSMEILLELRMKDAGTPEGRERVFQELYDDLQQRVDLLNRLREEHGYPILVAEAHKPGDKLH